MRALLLPLSLGLCLAAAGPAMAADVTVDVPGFEFVPPDQKIAVGDKVVWTFTDGGHTTTARRGQPDSWDSGLEDTGGRFERTFTQPGRYQYICRPHASFMKGVIEVGEDAESDTVDAFKTKRRGNAVTVSFALNEPALATYRLKGPTRRTVSRGRLEAGRHSFKVRRLKPGRYRGTLTLQDDFDNKVSPKNAFVIR